MKISAIIVSDAKTKAINDMVDNMIKSIRNNNENVEIIIVEKQKEYNITYSGYDIFLKQTESFNYNANLNIGIEKASGDYIALLNNDLIFTEKDTFKKLIEKMNQYNVDVASPVGDDRELIRNFIGYECVKGYRVRQSLYGWFIFLKRETLSKIGKLNTDYEFWSSDEIFLDQCKENNLIVASFPKIYVKHLESKTLRTLNKNKQLFYTRVNYMTYLKNKRKK